MRRRHGLVACCGLVALFIVALGQTVFAAQSQSSNYSVDQVFMGAGGELNACSGGQYCAKQSAGEIAAGHTAGSAFQAQAGFNVNREPYLAFSVAGGPTDLGYLSEIGVSTTTATFAVKTYLASGYVVQIASDPPTNTSTGYMLNALSSPTGSSVGNEQFGMNLVENSAPVAMGADPVQVPDNTFSYGTVASGYNTPNVYKYVKGDTIASSNQSSGQTDYTLSFIYNISHVTPSGLYKFNGTLVATSTF